MVVPEAADRSSDGFGEREEQPHSDASSTLCDRLSQVGAARAACEVSVGVEFALAAAITGRERVECVATLHGNVVDTADRKDELDTQRRPRSCQPHRDRPHRRPAFGGKRDRGCSGDLVREEEFTIVRVEAGQGDGQCVGLLALERALFGSIETAVFDEAMGVSACGRLGPVVLSQGVACGDDRIRTQRFVFQTRVGFGHLDECLLSDVFDQVHVAGADSNACAG